MRNKSSKIIGAAILDHLYFVAGANVKRIMFSYSINRGLPPKPSRLDKRTFVCRSLSLAAQQQTDQRVWIDKLEGCSGCVRLDHISEMRFNRSGSLDDRTQSLLLTVILANIQQNEVDMSDYSPAFSLSLF